MKSKILSLILTSAFIFTTGCVNQTVKQQPAVDEPIVHTTPIEPEPEIIELPPLPEPKTQEEFIAVNSLISTGNNMRLKAAIEKARNGGQVNIAAIGGSITEGAGAKPNSNCYASLFYEKFKEEFGGDIKFANAGMAGTPSNLGWIRYGRDVFGALGGNPDILIIEFAVNDTEDQQYGTDGAAYESMVHDVLSLPDAPAVILLFSVFSGGNKVLQDKYIPVGEVYQLPMVSIGNGIEERLKSGELLSADFFADQWHPTNYGHELMADALMHMVRVVDREPKADSDLIFPAESALLNGLSYSEMVSVFKNNIPADFVITEGAFNEIDGSLYTLEYNNKKTFPENWHRVSDVNNNEPFTIEVICKNFQIVTKSSGGFGNAEVYVDGKLVKTINGSAGGAWNNAITTQLFNNHEAQSHVIEIRMAECSEEKAFTVLGFGYTV